LLQRETVRERANDLIAEGFSRENMTANSTGGSTGVPVHFWLDEESRAWRDAASDWAFAKIGHRPGDRVGLIWGGNADPAAPRTMRVRVSRWLSQSQLHDCYRLSDRMLDEIDEKLAAYRPDFLRCYTSALTLHAHRLRRQGKRPSYPRYGIITGGEKLDLTQRKIIEDVFSVPVYESYGSRDCALMAMQLSASDPRLHIPGANIMLEPYGDDDPSSGREILVTDLHRRGMPFLRYQIGDRARFPSNSGDSPAEILEEVTGRTVDLVYLSDGRVIHGIQFPRLFRDFDVCEFQVVQQTNGDVEVLLVPGPSLVDRDAEKIERILKSILNGNALSVSLVPSINRTSGGKLRPVTSSYRPADAPI